MRPLRALAVYLLAVFAGGALLAPGLHALTQWAAHHYPSLATLAAQPFRRFVTRSLMLFALVGLWPLLRALGARSWADLGLTPLAGQHRYCLRGFLLGFCSLALVTAGALAVGARTLDGERTAEQIVRHLFNAAAAAGVVALLEEVLFRGGIFGGLRRVFHWGLALGISSAAYALMHFLAPVESSGPVRWYSGLVLLPQMLGGFGDLHKLMPGLLSLMLAGAILAVIYQRTGTLYGSIGLHAAWIFWLKSYKFFTKPTDTGAWLWGTDKMIDGWLALGVLALTLWAAGRVFRQESQPAFRQ